MLHRLDPPGPRDGFTLVEVLVTVAIIGILASIAFPMYGDMQLRAKRAELPSLMSGIVDAEVGYEAAFDSYIGVFEFTPDSYPTKQARPWVAGSGFDTLGWAPGGEVRGSYAVYTVEHTGFEVVAMCDTDGDHYWSWWIATPNDGPIMTTDPDWF